MTAFTEVLPSRGRVFSELMLAVVSHEAAHVAAGLLDGIVIDEVTVDRSRNDLEGLGIVRSRFADDDTRSVSVKAEAGARMALAGMLVESKADPRASDGDVRSAYELAAIAGASDQDEWVHDRAVEVQRIIRSNLFVRLVDALSFELLQTRTLGAPTIKRISGQVLTS